MVVTEIFRSADFRKKFSGKRKENSSATKIFRNSNKRKKKSRNERSGILK